MKLTPEMIDGATIQLRMLFENDPSVPVKVKEKGLDFISELEAWSEEMKKEKAA
jgi:hypothetical protein